MTRKPITINRETFPTKAALKDHIRTIVARYRDDEVLVPGDLAFMLDVLEYHRWRDQKVGCGVASMTVRTNLGFTRGFWLTRTDGTTTDFSWIECIDRPSRRKDVLEAMRHAIIDQKTEFRDRCFAANPAAICPVTGEPLTPETCHVDHEAPLTFDVLASQFIVEHGVDVETVGVGGFGDGEQGKYFLDEDVFDAWREYHRRHAQLRVLSKRGNLSLAKRGPIGPQESPP